MNVEKTTCEKQNRTKVHFVDNYLLNPTNPITVNLIGAGGTGSKVLTALMEMNHSLLELGHAGLFIRLWDDDIITDANLGRQRFFESELGLPKSVALINRVNRCTGTNWKAENRKYERNYFKEIPENALATLTFTCVDNVQTRFEVADILKELNAHNRGYRDKPKYWLDFGNNRYTGQVILSTIGEIKQPDSEKYKPVENLPFVTEEYGDLLRQSELKDDAPSCSLAEALEKQDLYINSALTQMGCSLLWGLFRNGMTEYRGFFLNLRDFRSQPIPVGQ